MMFFSSSTPKQDPVDLAKEWKRNLQKESRKIDRDILGIKRQEDRAMKECRALVKANRLSAAKILAKEVANTRKTVERMYTAKAQLNSVATHLQTSISLMKMQGCMTKSAEVMAAMNKLVNVKEIRETMQTMAREMEKTGLVDEIIGDTLDSMDSDAIDSAADLEVDRIITEITTGVLAPASSAPTTGLKNPQQAAQKQSATETNQKAESGDLSTEELLSRLQAL